MDVRAGDMGAMVDVNGDFGRGKEQQPGRSYAIVVLDYLGRYLGVRREH
jgi:hypothetical protein